MRLWPSAGRDHRIADRTGPRLAVCCFCFPSLIQIQRAIEPQHLLAEAVACLYLPNFQFVSSLLHTIIDH